VTGHSDLDWLVAERPATEGPDALATRRARRELLAHITGAPAAAPAAAPRSRRRRRGLLLAGAATVAAAAALVVALAPSGGHGGLKVEAASAATLVKLSAAQLAQPRPAGDATLVRRDQHYPDGRSIAGYDLYADDGTYYYGATRAELHRAVRKHEHQYDELRRMIAATIAAPHLAPGVARQRFLKAGGVKPYPGASDASPKTREAAKQIAEKQATAQKMAGRQEPVSQTSLDDNFIWASSLDVLVAGAVRPQVRAGVMALLATISSVSVTEGRRGGRPTLTLRNTDFPGRYVESLTVDARTGEPIGFVGGVDGQTPGVTVDYDAARTTLARQGAG
jgi:hypothetical protein